MQVSLGMSQERREIIYLPTAAVRNIATNLIYLCQCQCHKLPTCSQLEAQKRTWNLVPCTPPLSLEVLQRKDIQRTPQTETPNPVNRHRTARRPGRRTPPSASPRRRPRPGPPRRRRRARPPGGVPGGVEEGCEREVGFEVFWDGGKGGHYQVLLRCNHPNWVVEWIKELAKPAESRRTGNISSKILLDIMGRYCKICK